MTVASRARIAAGLLAVAAAGHGLAVAHHADAHHGGLLVGAAFSAVAVAQLVAAAALARHRPENRLRQLVVGGTIALVAVWVVSRTVGLPDGSHPRRAEEIGGLDALTVAAQLGVVGLLVRQRRRGLSIALACSLAGTIVGVAALNVSSVAATVGATPHRHSEDAVPPDAHHGDRVIFGSRTDESRRQGAAAPDGEPPELSRADHSRVRRSQPQIFE